MHIYKLYSFWLINNTIQYNTIQLKTSLIELEKSVFELEGSLI